MVYIISYLSIGLAGYAWLLSYRIDKYRISDFCRRMAIPQAQRWLIFVILAVVFAVFWPIAIPMMLMSIDR